MFRCLSHKAALGLVLWAVFVCSGCVQPPHARYYHLVCWTDPPNCGPCRTDEPRVHQLEKVMDVRFPPPDESPDGRIPYYKFYTPDGKLIYQGHDLSQVRPAK